MFPLKKYIWPSKEGKFGVVRKYDIHTGIDIYCDPGSNVYSIGNGVVIGIENFTGPSAGSPWWNETQSVLVYNSGMYGGTVCYGEIEPAVHLGQMVSEGDIIGFVKTVLKEDKGKPMTMLHFEQYKGFVKESVVWPLNTKKPTHLRNPTKLLNFLRGYGMKDLLGQPIRVGDLVANCVLQYRSAAMRLGVVKTINGKQVNIFRSSGRSGTTYSHDLVVIRWDQLAPEHENYQKLINMRDSLVV